MLKHTLKPMVFLIPIKKSDFEISEKRLGVTAVIEHDKVIEITDGDIRRMLNERDSFAELTAKDIMTKNPKLIQSNDMVVDALNILEDFHNAISCGGPDEYKGVYIYMTF
jgi:arabinose-5-phosphate isomerase